MTKTTHRRDRSRRKRLEKAAAGALADGPHRGYRDRPLRDLSDVAGTWVEDPATDAALAAQRRVSRAGWK